MENIEKNVSVLKNIASRYEDSSDEYEVLTLAAIALHFVWQEETRHKFRNFLENFNRDLTEDEIQHLRGMGIDIE
jgi:hypothetical protein